MSININMVNVGDADAIIVTLKERGKTAVVLIDGGNKNSEKVLKCLERILTQEGKKAPDLIVCTHCDGDHIGGIIDIVEKYKDNIKETEIWVHEPAFKSIVEDIKDALNLSNQSSGKTILPLIECFKKKYKIKEEAEVLVETFKQLIELHKKIKLYGIRRVNPFGKGAELDEYGEETFLKEFPEFKVIGPTEKFYNQFTEEVQKKGAALLLDEDLLFDNKKNLCPDIFDKVLNENLEPCDRLKHSTKQTWLNTLSIIILYTDEDGKKYLFPGDAGIDSFENIPEYETLLKDIFYMTLPHHGSKNNISKQLIEIMNPKVVFISASGKNGHPDEDIIACLKRHDVKKGHDVKIRQTHKYKDCIDLNQELEGVLDPRKMFNDLLCREIIE